MWTISKTFRALIGLGLVAMAVPSFASTKDTWTITRLLEADENTRFAILESTSGKELPQGAQLVAKRVLSPRGTIGTKMIDVETGALLIEKSEKDYAIAKVVEDGSKLSKAAFPKFPGIMTGDKIELLQPKIVSNKVITKDINISYYDLFLDPKQNPSSYEISEEGLDQLVASIKAGQYSRDSHILIEGHTDRRGPSQANQVESYQRALAIKQVLVERLGFEPTSIIALGLGESELKDDSYVAGFERRNRRIVIKTLSNDSFNLKEVY